MNHVLQITLQLLISFHNAAIDFGKFGILYKTYPAYEVLGKDESSSHAIVSQVVPLGYVIGSHIVHLVHLKHLQRRWLANLYQWVITVTVIPCPTPIPPSVYTRTENRYTTCRRRFQSRIHEYATSYPVLTTDLCMPKCRNWVKMLPKYYINAIKCQK